MFEWGMLMAEAFDGSAIFWLSIVNHHTIHFSKGSRVKAGNQGARPHLDAEQCLTQKGDHQASSHQLLSA